VLAAPVAPPDTLESLRAEVDEAVCLEVFANFGAIGQFYVDFHQVSDDEVIAILDRSAAAMVEDERARGAQPWRR
jgi:predicted phosphoribosyltransferase